MPLPSLLLHKGWASVADQRTKASLSYCGREVRKYDYDRYLSSLFLDSDKREALFALYAFHQEVSKTADVVSETITGMIRLQWWRESIEGLYEEPPIVRKHAVVEALNQAVACYHLPMKRFQSLITVREVDLDQDPHPNLAALENYCLESSGYLFELVGRVCFDGQRPTGEQIQALQNLGVAWALVGLVRSAAHFARQRKSIFPSSVMQKHGVRESDLFELRSRLEIQKATQELCKRAEETMAKALTAQKSFPVGSAFVALLNIKHLKLYLKRLEAVSHDPFALSRSEAFKGASLWKLTWALISKRL